MIKTKMADVIKKKASFGYFPDSRPSQPEKLGKGIPTLEKGVYREFSPMLRDRFEVYGRWEHATHGTWLGLKDMELLWENNIQDNLLVRIKYQAEILKNHWQNNAYGLFKDERLSLFAGSDYSNESMFLLWLDFEAEPEIWVYDSNGESRYKNIKHYLVSYLTEDLSASEQSWRAST
jgi:hypothetical protein